MPAIGRLIHGCSVIALPVIAFTLSAQNFSLDAAEKLYREGHYAECKRELVKLPASAGTLMLQGEIAAAEHNPHRAVQLLERGSKLDPRNSAIWFALGNAYADLVLKSNVFQQPRYAVRTRECFERAVALNPNHIEARYALVQYYILAPAFIGGSEGKALHEAKEIRSRDPLAGHRAFARIYVAKQQHDLARQEWLQAVAEAPSAVASHEGLGLFYLQVDKNYDAAEKEYEAALKIDSRWMPGWFHLGHLAAVSGRNLRRGRAALERYLQYSPGPDEPQATGAHFWMARILERMGDSNAAHSHYLAAGDYEPSHSGD